MLLLIHRQEISFHQHRLALGLLLLLVRGLPLQGSNWKLRLPCLACVFLLKLMRLLTWVRLS